jgi:hypothetical protein
MSFSAGKPQFDIEVHVCSGLSRVWAELITALSRIGVHCFAQNTAQTTGPLHREAWLSSEPNVTGRRLT